MVSTAWEGSAPEWQGWAWRKQTFAERVMLRYPDR
jgi:hypothetical protein